MRYSLCSESWGGRTGNKRFVWNCVLRTDSLCSDVLWSSCILWPAGVESRLFPHAAIGLVFPRTLPPGVKN